MTLTPEQKLAVAKVERELEAAAILHIRGIAPKLEVSVRVLDEDSVAISEPMRQIVTVDHDIGSTMAAYCFPAINRIFMTDGPVRTALREWWATKIQEVLSDRQDA